jgi:hypothetical protein
MNTRYHTVKTLWIGPELSQLEALSLRSFMSCGHRVELFTYQDVDNIPKGVITRDANEILPESLIFKYRRKPSVAGFANWFRYTMLYKEGGIWADTDVICLKYFDFKAELVFGKEEYCKINNAVLGGEEGHFLFKFMMNQAENPNLILEFDTWKDKRRKFKRRFFQGNQRGNIKWGEVGPIGITRAVQHFNLEQFALPYHTFYPIHSKCWDSVFDKSLKDFTGVTRNSYALHLWHEMYRGKPNFDKNGTFDKDSLIEQLKTRYFE